MHFLHFCCGTKPLVGDRVLHSNVCTIKSDVLLFRQLATSMSTVLLYEKLFLNCWAMTELPWQKLTRQSRSHFILKYKGDPAFNHTELNVTMETTAIANKLRRLPSVCFYIELNRHFVSNSAIPLCLRVFKQHEGKELQTSLSSLLLGCIDNL